MGKPMPARRKQMTRTLAMVALASGLAASPVAADTLVIDPVHSEVSFQIRHFVTNVRGRFTDFAGTIVADKDKPEASQVEFTVRAASIDTAQENRDKHLRSADFFDAERFPEITFKSTKVKATGKDKYAVTGNLTMHGVTRPIILAVTNMGSAGTGADAKFGFEGTTTLNRKDFGILWNKALDAGGYVLGDDVTVSINIEATHKKEAAAK
jgi:polyisoprenoid-binding protein YceI